MELRVYGAQVPLVVFGVIALLAALLVTFMPETSRTRLPDTIQVSTYLREPLINLRFVLTYTDNALLPYALLQDGEHIGSGDSLWSSCRRPGADKR